MTFMIPPLRKKFVVFFLVFLTLISSNSCNYFIVKQGPETLKETVLKKDQLKNRYLIHAQNDVFDVYDLQFDSVSMSGVLQRPYAAIRYTEGRSFEYETSEKDIINEVHLYADTALATGAVRIPLSTIKELKVIDMDAGKTILSHTFSIIGIAVVTILLLFIIIALTKSSCPYVYVYNGTDFIFEGETFGGAIGSNMERDDYMPLPSAISELGKYRIKINDELKEHQFIDVAELVVVDHPKGTSVLLDSRGNPQLISEPMEPVDVTSYNGTDLKAVLAKRDNSVFLFDNEEYSKNGVVLKFANNGADDGRLVLRGKNTLWFDYIYGEFLSKFGSYYETWTEKQEKLSYAEKMQLTLDSDIPLMVYLKVDGAWQSVDYLMTVGPLASRDFVIPMDLRQADDALIEIKLETGFMFWELDYAAIDLTANAPLRTMTYAPESAIDVNNNRNWTDELSGTDNKYMVQTVPGESTDIVFNIGDRSSSGVQTPSGIQTPSGAQTPSGIQTASGVATTSDELVQSVFLHTQGYYTLVRDFEGAPQFTELKRFKIPGHFSDFSKQSYEKRLTDTPNYTQH